MIKESVPQKYMIFANIYVPNIGSPKYIKEILTNLKGEIGSNTIIVGILIPYLCEQIGHLDRKSIRKYWP